MDPNKLTPNAIRYNWLHQEMEEHYDKKTNHSIIGKKQKRWSRKIKRLVKDLHEYHSIEYPLEIH